MEVITSVITAPYPFYLLFVPRVTSNEREVMIGKVAVPKQISMLHRKNSCKISVCPFKAWIFVLLPPGCYLTFVSSTLFDLSNRRSSKKFVFTCWSVLTDFCHYLHLLLIDSFLAYFWEIELFEGIDTVACVFRGIFAILKLKPQGLLSFEYTNVANEDCVQFCMKEKFQV